jgi:FlaG/FlaF family flagellin (archaellin)
MRSFSERARSGYRLRRSRHGVSDVVGTILLLALTITLFGTVFLFVNTFPQPAPQPTSQFSASLQFANVSGVGVVISTVNIVHLAGPTLFDNLQNQIWITSAAKPGAFTSSFSVASGGLGAWAIGQTWSLNVTSKSLNLPDNLTISIVSSGVLVYHNTLPGANPSIPPQFTNEGTVPALPTTGNPFKVYAQISDVNLPSTSTHVTLNYSLLPGLYGARAVVMTYSAENGTWQAPVPASTTSSGVYFVFVSAIDSIGLRNTVAVEVTLEPPAPPVPGNIQVTLVLNQTAAVNGTPATIAATLYDNGPVGGSANFKYYVNGGVLGTTTGSVTAGGITTEFFTWTPTKVGTAVVVAQGSVPGVGISNGTLTLTIFPKIAFVAINSAYTTAKTWGAADEAGWLRAALVADGIPFNTFTYSCKGNLPAASTFNGYQAVIVDFGSSTSGGCISMSATDTTTLTTLASTASVWVVGANAWSTSATGCPAAAFQTAFGLKGLSGTACAAALALPQTNLGVYTPSAVFGLQSAGVPATYTVNKTVAANATFQAMDLTGALQSGANAVTWFKVNGKPTGTFFVNGRAFPQVILAVDPAQLVQTLPGGQQWGAGAGSSEVVYNVVDWMSGLTPPGVANSNRQQTDFAIGEMQLINTKHASPTTVVADVRANGLAGAAVTVILYVNGTPAIYGGQVVSASVAMSGGGQSLFVQLTWQAQTAGPYTLSVAVIGFGDANVVNNQFGAGLLPVPWIFG